MDWKTLTVDEVKKVNMQFANNNGDTALHFLAGQNTNTVVIKTAIELGADINQQDKQGHTPLHYAAIKNTNPDIAILLIDAGADINIKDNDGKTPIEIAEYNRNFRNQMQRKIKKHLDKREKELEKQYDDINIGFSKQQAKSVVKILKDKRGKGKEQGLSR